MDLFRNPFYLLNATPRDNLKRILELEEERGLLMDAKECAQASADLRNPRKRLSSEIAWLPCLGSKREKKLIGLIASNPDKALNVDNLPPIARVNLLATGLFHLSKVNGPEDISKWILKLAWEFEKVFPKDVCFLVNEDRVTSGFSKIDDISAVEEEIRARRQYFVRVVTSALNKLKTRNLVKALTIVIESATDKGKKHGPILIDDVVEHFELKAKPFFEREGENIKKLLDQVEYAIECQQPMPIIEKLLSQIEKVVMNWDMVAQPIQVSNMSRGIEHEQSLRVAGFIRELALTLHNEYQMTEVSQRLSPPVWLGTMCGG